MDRTHYFTAILAKAQEKNRGRVTFRDSADGLGFSVICAGNTIAQLHNEDIAKIKPLDVAENVFDTQIKPEIQTTDDPLIIPPPPAQKVSPKKRGRTKKINPSPDATVDKTTPESNMN